MFYVCINEPDEQYLDVLHCFLYQRCQVHVCASTSGLRVASPVRPQITYHQVEVVPPQSTEPQRLADRVDVRETHPSSLKLGSLFYQPNEK